MARRKAKPMEIAEPLPCPCCGAGHPYCGPMSGLTEGVHCEGCGLKIERSIPMDHWPSHCDTIADVRADVRREAIAAWNRRTN